MQYILEDLHIRDLKKLGKKFGVSTRKKSDLIKKLINVGITDVEVSLYPLVSKMKNFNSLVGLVGESKSLEDKKGVTIEERLKVYKIINEMKNKNNYFKPCRIADRVRRELYINMDSETVDDIFKQGILGHGEIINILKNKPKLFFPTRNMTLYNGTCYDIDIILIDERGIYYLIEVSYSSDTRKGVGQLLCYRKLIEIGFGRYEKLVEIRAKIKDVQLVLITNKINIAIKEVCSDLEIILIDASPHSIENKMKHLK